MRQWRGSDLAAREGFFDVLATTGKTQFATMVLGPGQVSGEFGNDHSHADQWLVVIEGKGEVKSGDGVESVGPGDVVLIPAPEKHQIRGIGEGPMKSVTFYGPVAYPDDAE